ncbi:MAG: ATP-binding cassette domain-containing protein [Saccharofermentans sp.]|nr:ATP-binding cassette domain-containing protein [Saccharofermentans sp.]
MKYIYGDLVIKNKLLIKAGELYLPEKGVYIFTGDNGTGKSLFMTRMNSDNVQTTSMMPQFSEVIPNLSVIENIAMSLDVHEKEKIKRILHKYGLTYLEKKAPKTMSGGEKRLVSFLRCVFSEATFLLLDEPTNDLDYRIVEKVKEIIHDYSDKKLFLIATHDGRLDDIKTGSIRIENQRIIVSEIVGLSFDGSPQINEESQINMFGDRLEFLAKSIWQNKVFVLFVLFVIALVSCYYIWIHKDMIDRDEDILIDEQEAAVFLSVSSIGGPYIQNGALPIDIIKVFSVSEIWSKDGYSSNEIKYTADVYECLEMTSSKDVRIYPLELYDPEERQTIYTLDFYMKEFLDVNSDDPYIEIDSYRSFRDVFFEKTGSFFDDNIFDDTITKLSELHPNAKPVFCAVSLTDGYSFSTFISDCFPKSDNSNLYAYSRNTHEMSRQITAIAGYKAAFFRVLFFCAIFILVEMLYVIVHLKYKASQIRILICYGFDLISVKRKIVEINNNLLVRIGFIVLYTVVVNVFFWKGSPEYMLLKLLPVLLFFLFDYTGYWVEKLVLKIGLNIVCSWKCRR